MWIVVLIHYMEQYSAVLAQLDDDYLRQGGYVIVVVCYGHHME